MTQDEFNFALKTFLDILERQPNVLSPLQPGTNVGARVAESAWSFIEEFEKQRKAKVTG
ncbi:hypothetical protein [Achromobacter marplatensis]